MLSGSAVLRVLLLLAVVAGITAVVQVFWLRSSAPDPVRTTVPQETRPSETRRAETPPGPARTEPARPEPAKSEPAKPEPAPARPAEAPPLLPRIAEPAPPPAASSPPPPAQTDPTEAAAENAPPAAVALVDLNTATLAELNGLKGGGAIGRTIIGNRPYASVDQLLSKRVLNRATYQRIKDQVIVR